MKLLQLWQLRNLDHIVREYIQIPCNTLDRHAPLRTKTLKETHKQPWFTDAIRQEIRLQRLKERKWLKDQVQYNWQAFRCQRRHVANIIQAAKWNHYSNLLTENKSNIKEVSNIANNLLYRNEPLALPLTNDKQLLANEFNEFFITKVQTNMNDLQPSDDNPMDPTYMESDYLTKVRFNTFQKVTEDHLVKLVQKSTIKSCELDPIPTSLLKKHLNVMVPVLQHIINLYLTEGHFSDELKQVLLRPLLKRYL